MLGFKSFASAASVLAGIELVNMIRKGQFTPGLCPFLQLTELAANPSAQKQNSEQPQTLQRNLSETAISATQTTLPATAKQLAYARKIAEQQNVVMPWEIQQDRRAMRQWIDTQRLAPRVRDTRPSSKQVAFTERIARIKHSPVPNECFRDRNLMSRWIDSNNP